MQAARRQGRLVRELLHRGKGPCGDNRPGPVLPEMVDLPEPQPQGPRFDAIVPLAEINIDRPDLDPVRPRILHQLRRRVKTHGLGIEQGSGENGGVMAFQPGRYIDQMGKGLRMAFRKAIAAKAFDLFVAPLGKITLITTAHHALDHLVAISRHCPHIAEGRHCTAQAIRLVRGKGGGHHGKLHGLFLKQRHATGAVKNVVQFAGIMRRGRRWKIDRLFLVAAAQIGVDHIPLDRPGPNNRDLNDQIIKLPGLQPGEHVDLGTAFHLKGADAVALLQHLVHRRIFCRYAVQPIVAQSVFPDEVEAFADTGQHPQRQYIDLQQVERGNVVLVPFDERAIFHGAIMDGNGFIQTVFGEHKATNMLRQMARKIEQLADQRMQLGNLRIGRIKACLHQPLFRQLPPEAAPDRPRQPRRDILGQAKRLAHLAHRAARTVMDHGGGDGRTVAFVPPVDILHDLLAALMLEIHINVGRLVPFFRQKTREEQIVGDRIDRGNPQQIADYRIGGRASSLTQDGRLLRAGKLDDVVHGQEIGGIILLPDKLEFLLQYLHQFGRQPVGMTALRLCHDEMFQPALCIPAFWHGLVRIFVTQFRQIK